MKAPTLEVAEAMRKIEDRGGNPGFCRACGKVMENGFEPDAEGYDCQVCEAKGTADGIMFVLIELV